MTWTAPRTWAAYEKLAASLLNTHIRDNLLALRTPAHGRGTRATGQSIPHLSSTALITYPTTAGSPGIAADGLFYVSASGLYLVTGSLITESAAFTSVTINFRNNAGVREGASDQTTITDRRRLAMAETIYLAADDWVGMTCTQINGSAAARNVDYARFAVTWIGGV